MVSFHAAFFQVSLHYHGIFSTFQSHVTSGFMVFSGWGGCWTWFPHTFDPSTSGLFPVLGLRPSITILSFYQNWLINNNTVNRKKCMYWSICIIGIGSQRKQVNVNFNLTQTNSWCINYNQILHKNHKLCILQIGRKSHWKC